MAMDHIIPQGPQVAKSSVCTHSHSSYSSWLNHVKNVKTTQEKDRKSMLGPLPSRLKKERPPTWLLPHWWHTPRCPAAARIESDIDINEKIAWNILENPHPRGDSYSWIKTYIGAQYFSSYYTHLYTLLLPLSGGKLMWTHTNTQRWETSLLHRTSWNWEPTRWNWEWGAPWVNSSKPTNRGWVKTLVPSEPQNSW